MALIDSILKFIGSKWFALFLAVGLAVALPFTWHNFQVVYSAGKMSQYWWLVAVFGVNVISIGLSVYKFLNMLHKPKEAKTEEW